MTNAKGSYGYDLQFLKKHGHNLIELVGDEGKAKVLLSAEYQGRVMTSTATGDTGSSFGWINYGLIASGEKKKQFNPVGGENRFWMGPEGGQYSIYFNAGDSFNIAHWQVPPIIDTVSYDIKQADSSQAVFTKNASFTNYSGTHFTISIERKISLLHKAQVSETIGKDIPENIHSVGFETENSITNTGTSDWKKENGLLSIWLLGMFTPTPQTVIIIPFHPQKDARSLITDNYFGTIPPERLQVKDSVLFFTCDGKYRSKIGISPMIAKPMAASFDFKNNVLTLIIPSIDKQGMYVNSKWEIQKEPYKGDVINSYNDGPLQDGSQLGPFYEIESSSPAKELKSGERLAYSQITCHLQGDYSSLRLVAKQLLGVDLDDIKR
ncbi:MAG TPA: DUF6786 family protein [Chitinophagaceae bacterium]|nr:DUF6786 family protein [Chitinophagaceae bacterium]